MSPEDLHNFLSKKDPESFYYFNINNGDEQRIGKSPRVKNGNTLLIDTLDREIISLPLDWVKSVEEYQPTANALRLLRALDTSSKYEFLFNNNFKDYGWLESVSNGFLTINTRNSYKITMPLIRLISVNPV